MSAGRSRHELVLRLQTRLERFRVHWDHNSRFCENVHQCVVSARLGCCIRYLALPVTGEVYRGRCHWVERYAVEAFRRSNRAWLEGMRMAGPAGRLPL